MSEFMKQFRKSFDYIIEENRRKTFKKWVFTNKDTCNADKMAEAGFIFIGNKNDPDSVKCFFCNKSLDGWDSTDDPWEEHLKHSPKCSYANLQKPQESLTINQFFDIQKEFIEKLIKSYYDKITEDLENTFEELEQEILSQLELVNK